MTTTADNWRVWNKDDKVELRTYKRATGELPEMESTKQLVKLVKEVYQPGYKIADVGCAAGHYYNGLKRISEDINYTGVDATQAYIEFAKQHFTEGNVQFHVGDIFNLSDDLGKFDVVYCCNVILHLPDFREPVRNLLKITDKYCFIRTLISDRTHLSKLVESDEYDENGDPIEFVFQNTYGRNYVEKFIKEQGDFEVEFIKDEFDATQINKEYENYEEVLNAVTRVQDNVQIAGSKVFEWEWVKVTRK